MQEKPSYRIPPFQILRNTGLLALAIIVLTTFIHSADGLKYAKLHLAEDGILGVWSYAESSPFADALHDAFRENRIVPVTVFNNLINEQQTDWLFFARD